jgi:soluble lytic murein transglycosylase-like protein
MFVVSSPKSPTLNILHKVIIHPNICAQPRIPSSIMPAESASNPMPIAIVGMSCRFPGDAVNPSQLWEMLLEGKSAWSPIPKDKFNADAFFHPNPDRNGAVSGCKPTPPEALH